MERPVAVSAESNMYVRTPIIHRLILLGLAGLLASASPAAAAVFCVTGEGHAAIEVMPSICCENGIVPLRGADRFESLGSVRAPYGCGPCVDFQFTTPSLVERPGKATIQAHDAPAADSAISPTGTPARTQFRPAVRLSNPKPAHDVLASVVLLI